MTREMDKSTFSGLGLNWPQPRICPEVRPPTITLCNMFVGGSIEINKATMLPFPSCFA